MKELLLGVVCGLAFVLLTACVTAVDAHCVYEGGLLICDGDLTANQVVGM